MHKIILLGLLVIAINGCSVSSEENKMNLKKATFAGGCFWCMEPPFQKLDGVIDVKAGYTGGNKVNQL